MNRETKVIETLAAVAVEHYRYCGPDAESDRQVEQLLEATSTESATATQEAVRYLQDYSQAL